MLTKHDSSLRVIDFGLAHQYGMQEDGKTPKVKSVRLVGGGKGALGVEGGDANAERRHVQKNRKGWGGGRGEGIEWRRKGGLWMTRWQPMLTLSAGGATHAWPRLLIRGGVQPSAPAAPAQCTRTLLRATPLAIPRPDTYLNRLSPT